MIRLVNQSVLEMNCTLKLVQAARILKNQLEVKMAEIGRLPLNPVQENKLGADLYAVTIIGAFASIIIILMFRSIRPHQSLDDQVTLMMASMQMRVEVDELARRKMKMKEAKKKAQDWIKELRQRSLRSLSRSTRRTKSISSETPPITQDFFPLEQCIRGNNLIVPGSPSCKSVKVEKTQENTSNRQSICSAPTPVVLELSLPARAKSHLGFVPEIVVTEPRPRSLLTPPHRRRSAHNASSPNLQISRKSSASSYRSSVSPSLCEELVFQFPDSCPETPNDSPPYLI